MKKIAFLFILIIIFLAAKVLLAKEVPFNLDSATLVKCYDGDTCTFIINDKNFPNYLNPMHIRVYGVDTKEMKSKDPKDAIEAKNFTVSFIKSSNIKLKDCIKDKYFRFDCKFINENGKDLAKELIDNNLGVPYFGGHKY